MFPIVVAMLVIVALAALVVGYVAYPQWGRDFPRAPWLPTAMTKAVDKAAPDPVDAKATDRSPRVGSNSA